MNLILIRYPNGKATPGMLYVDDAYECRTLEDEVREGPKVSGETAIPAGSYKVIIDWSNRFQREMPHVLDVPGFEGIRFHSGNTIEDTAGCILVGTELSSDGLSLTGSRDAFNSLFAKLTAATDTISLTVY